MVALCICSSARISVTEDPLDHLQDIQDDFFAMRRDSLITTDKSDETSGESRCTDSLKRYAKRVEGGERTR
jgi:hypothetical protein